MHGEIWMELHVLHQHGWSISALAREFGLNWRTVQRELASPGPRRYPERARPTALTEAQLRHVERRLGVCPPLRGTDLHGELCREYGYTGSYPAFARHLRHLRPAQVRDPAIRFETDPGVQTQADWAHVGVWPLADGMVELHAMVTILGCSRAPAIRFATDCTRGTSLERLVRCLDDLGGVTREVLTDRDPAFCIGATSDGRAILAPEWVDLSRLLGLVPKACRPYRAQTQGKVERWCASSRRACCRGCRARCFRAPRRWPRTMSSPGGGSPKSCCHGGIGPRSRLSAMPGPPSGRC